MVRTLCEAVLSSFCLCGPNSRVGASGPRLSLVRWKGTKSECSVAFSKALLLTGLDTRHLHTLINAERAQSAALNFRNQDTAAASEHGPCLLMPDGNQGSLAFPAEEFPAGDKACVHR